MPFVHFHRRATVWCVLALAVLFVVGCDPVTTRTIEGGTSQYRDDTNVLPRSGPVEVSPSGTPVSLGSPADEVTPRASAAASGDVFGDVVGDTGRSDDSMPSAVPTWPSDGTRYPGSTPGAAQGLPTDAPRPLEIERSLREGRDWLQGLPGGEFDAGLP